MGRDILDKGIKAHTYKLRAQILKPIFLAEDSQSESCVQIDCQTNAGYLASLLFKNTASFEEESVCSMGCPTRKKILPVAQIDTDIISDNNFYNVINDNIILTGKRKCRKNCSGFETTTLCKIGK